jgi:hypothetical protein
MGKKTKPVPVEEVKKPEAKAEEPKGKGGKGGKKK